MTMLSILFVIGVAFMATMNFEADSIAAQARRDDETKAVGTISAGIGSTLRNAFTAGPGLAFSEPISAAAAAPFAEMPFVHNTFSPIEPVMAAHPGLDGIFGTNDDVGPDGVARTADDLQFVRFQWYTDVPAMQQRPSSGPMLPPSFFIDPSLPQMPIYAADPLGDSGLPVAYKIGRCYDGATPGPACSSQNDCLVGDCIGKRLIDADGDGIVDSVEFPAAELGLSESQLAELSAKLSPTSKPQGRVYAAVRIIPHGGMVNLNQSHPNLIENVLDLQTQWNTSLADANRDPVDNYFYHRPTRRHPPGDFNSKSNTYPTLTEEPILRRRVLLASEDPAPSILQGNPFVDVRSYPDMKSDMARFLMPPLGNTADFQSVSRISGQYQTRPFVPCSMGGDCLGNLDLWQVRMEPLTARESNPTGSLRDYDRRHLVTTVSHDDLLSRGARVHVRSVNVNTGQVEYTTADILQKMRQANQGTYNINNCPLLPFEYADYPQDLPNQTFPEFKGQGSKPQCDCPNSPGCVHDPRKGRLQLSLAWLDQAMKWQGTKPPLLYLDQVTGEPIQAISLIADVFAMMLQNLIGPDWEYRKAFDPATGAYDVGACTDSSQCLEGEYCRRAMNVAAGRCSSVPAYWDDIQCRDDNDCPSGEICTAAPAKPDGSPWNPPIKLCTDAWTGQRHSQALLSRTVASLTANLLDFYDDNDVPTRVPLRSFDFNRGKCFGSTSPNAELPCDSWTPGWAVPNECGGGAQCISANDTIGKEIDGWTIDVNSDNEPELVYVYGLERQPFITAIATRADVPDVSGAPGPASPAGWAVEVFNPYSVDLPTNAIATYWLYEVSSGFAGAPRVQLPVVVGDPASRGHFTVFYSESGTPPLFATLPTGSGEMDLEPLVSPPGFRLTEGSTLYLVLSYWYTGDPGPTEIVLDQFTIPSASGTSNIGVYGQIIQGAPLGPNVYVLSRAVPNPGAAGTSKWLATVPIVGQEEHATNTAGLATLGTWRGGTAHRDVHPVEVNFANTGAISNPYDLVQSTPPPLKSAFPTTGALLLMMRHANRGVTDFQPSRTAIGTAATQPVTELAFTTKLNEKTTYDVGRPIPPGGTTTATVLSSTQIDNGRLPIFDPGQDRGDADGTIGRLAVHHVPPQVVSAFDPPAWHTCCDPKLPLTDLNRCNWNQGCQSDADCTVGNFTFCERPTPGNLNSLPWGQMIFDYFTALPLSSPGPYPPCDPTDPNCPQPTVTDAERIAFASAVPRVDLGGLRVHGRINLNAAPWKVLAGLPYVPLERIPPEFQASIQLSLPLPTLNPPGYLVDSLGERMAAGIVAYREAREIRFLETPGNPATLARTGGYGDSPAPLAIPPPQGFRGWTMQFPEVRRGTGFMTVGELANVRHPESSLAYRIDLGIFDDRSDKPSQPNRDPDGNNGENFIAAAAPLIALGDWVTVRSQVFTVYGVFRGEDDETITDGDNLKKIQLRGKDVDSRAIRFQETIDRLPTFLGEPLPERIGDQTIARYLDLRND